MGIPPIGICSAVCGGGLCGADIPTLTAAIAPLNNAVLYDGSKGVIALNADGTAQTIHPVDQEVIFDLTNALGTVPNDAGRGLDIQAIKDAEDARKLTTAIDRVNVCLATSIANGDIEVLDVELEDNPPAGAIGLAVTYENLRLPKSSPLRQTPPTVRI